jgi:flagellar biosynthesis/type III secretory pathway protein FliH
MTMTGTRGSTPVSPRDTTGRIHRQLLQAKTAKDKAVKDQEAGLTYERGKRDGSAEGFDKGFDKGFDAGHDAGWSGLAKALADLYDTEDIEAVAEFLDEVNAGLS